MTTMTSGAGIADSYAGLVGALTNDSESGAGQVADVAISATGAVLDTVAALGDPLNALISAGIGWLLQHIKQIREPLDKLLGNPDAINAQIDQLKTAAMQVKQEAQAHAASMSQVDSWQSPAADNYKQQMDQLSGELTALGHTLDGTAAIVGVSGTLVMTIRSIVYQEIAQVCADWVEEGLLAVAAAPWTAGSSIAAFIGNAVIKMSQVGQKIATKLGKLVQELGMNASRMEQLAQMMKTLNKNLGRFTLIAGTAKASYDAAQPYPTQPAAGATA